jgi:hypothetical protein
MELFEGGGPVEEMFDGTILADRCRNGTASRHGVGYKINHVPTVQKRGWS